MKTGSENELHGNHFNSTNDPLGVTPLVDLGWLQAGRGSNIYVICELLRVALKNVPLHKNLEGMKVGIFSDAALKAAIKVTRQPNMASKITTFLPSFAKRYTSTTLFDGLN